MYDERDDEDFFKALSDALWQRQRVEKMDGGYTINVPVPCTANCPNGHHDNKGRAEKGLLPARCSLPANHREWHLCGCQQRWPLVIDESFED